MKKFSPWIIAMAFLFTQSTFAFNTSGKLLLTGGVNQLEGSAGGGLTPWAVIGGYGTRDQIGANTYYTTVNASDYTLESYGVLVGIYNRVELSYSKQVFDTEYVGGGLGIGNFYKFEQRTMGVKVRVYGDAVYTQDSLVPQIAIGAQFKENQNKDLVETLGAEDTSGIDYYVSATKILLEHSFLYNITGRYTKANQLGILGYGGDKNNDMELMLEGSIGYLLTRKLVIGLEYRQKPDNLEFAEEDDWRDIFVAWTPNKNTSYTFAYTELGSIVNEDNQAGPYFSAQIGF